MAAFMAGFASCDDTSDLGKMQINEELPRVPVDCVTIEAGSAYNNSALDLTAINDPKIQLVTTSGTKDLPDGATVTYGVEFSATNQFTDAVFRNLPADGSIEILDLDDIFRELFGMGPKPHTLYARYEALVNVNNQVSAVGTGDAVWQVVKSIEVTPIPKPMEERYFFLSDATNWNLGKADVVEMDHLAAENYNIYDYPYFWIVVTTTGDKTYCKIAPESANSAEDWGSVLGVEVDGTALDKGSVFAGGGAFVIEGAGKYIVRFNAMESTVTVAPATQALWTPGAGLNDWKPENSFPLVSNDYVNYSGFSYLGSEFKLTTQPDWNGKGDYGQGDGSGYIEYKTDKGNIFPTVTDFVFINVSTGSWMIKYDAVSSISMIGDFNGWASDVVMTHDNSWQIWTGDVTVPADKLGFKFRLNEDWTHDFGGSEALGEGYICYKGGNLSFPGSGTYTVTLDLSTVPYSYKYVKK